MVKMLLNKGFEPVVACTFHDITPRTVLLENLFELKDYSPISVRVRRM